MQIRKLKTSYQLIRTTYDQQKKRGVEKMVCSFPLKDLALPDAAEKILTESELKQLVDWLAARKREHEDEQGARELSHKIYRMRSTALALSGFREVFGEQEVAKEFTAEHANELWAELDATRRALRKAGYARPKA
ncbi:hypothetical protein GLGCALEP_06368 [Pseudomonas sp. MM221]|nr:hypothetical protein DBADOPDK_06213 [Pseudomonas sp. MM223]CAI3811104.1 hypothetical protein GLGCALEP_06368 [Pseudomonas sp. MM221]